MTNKISARAGADFLKRYFDVGTSYFPRHLRDKYHRIETLSLLCSEWEEVGHVPTKHRHQKTVSFFDVCRVVVYNFAIVHLF